MAKSPRSSKNNRRARRASHQNRSSNSFLRAISGLGSFIPESGSLRRTRRPWGFAGVNEFLEDRSLMAADVTFDLVSSPVTEDSTTHNVALTVTGNLSGVATAADRTITFTYGGTATQGAGQDYGAALALTYVVPQSDFSVTPHSFQLPVDILEDAVNERTQTIDIGFTLGADLINGITTSHTVSIADDDPTSLAFNPAVVNGVENPLTNGSASIALTVASEEATTVSFASIVPTGSPAAAAGFDFTLPVNITIPANSTAPVSVPIPVLNDVLPESIEFLKLQGALAPSDLDDDRTVTSGNSPDVSITSEDAGAPSVPASAFSATGTVRMVTSGGLVRFYDGTPGVEIPGISPQTANPGLIQVVGNNSDNTLIVDASVFAGNTVNFDGANGTADNDRLVVLGLPGGAAAYTYTGLGAGSVNVGGGPNEVTFSNLSPVLTNVLSPSVTLTLTANPDNAVLRAWNGAADATLFGYTPLPGENFLVLEDVGATFESTAFRVPTGSISVLGGLQADTLELDETAIAFLDSILYSGVITFNGQGANDNLILDDGTLGTRGLNITMNGGGGTNNVFTATGTGGTLNVNNSAGALDRTFTLQNLSMVDAGVNDGLPLIQAQDGESIVVLNSVTLSSADDVIIDLDAPEPTLTLSGTTFNLQTESNADVDGFITNVASPLIPIALGGNTLNMSVNEDTPRTFELFKDNRSITGVTATAGTGSATFSGSQITFTPQLNYSGSSTITATLSDSSTVVVNVTVNPVNDAPLIAFPATLSTNEDTALTISGATRGVTDVDDTAGPNYTVTFTVGNHGTLTVAAPYLGLSTGSGTNVVQFSGLLLSQINTILQDTAAPGIVYNPGAGLNNTSAPPNVPVIISASDGVNTTNANFVINVTPVNDAPTVTVPVGPIVGINEDGGAQSLGLGGAVVADDAVENAGTVQVTMTVTNGSLTAGSNTGSTITFTGTVAAVNALIGGATFTPTANFNGTAALTVSVNDQGNHGGGPGLTDTESVNITVAAVNDAPTLSLPAGPLAVAEDTFLPVAITIGDIDAGTGNLQLTVSATNGTITVDSVPGGVPAAAAAGSVTLTGTLTQLQTTIAANAVKFKGNLNYSGSAVVSAIINDMGNTGSPGALSSPLASVNVNIGAVNDPPVNTVPGPLTVNEDNLTGLIFTGATKISVDDVDGNQYTVTLTVNNGTLSYLPAGGLFSNSGNGTNTVVLQGTKAAVNNTLDGLTYVPNANYSGTETLTIVTNDNGQSGSGGAQQDTDTVAIGVNPINDAPTLVVPGTVTILEDASPHTISGFTVSDVDAGTGLLLVSLSVTNGTLALATTTGLSNITPLAMNASTLTFQGIVSDITTALNSLKYDSAQDYNGADTLNITVNDQSNTGAGGPMSATGTVAINITPVNDEPKAILAANTLNYVEDTAPITAPVTIVNFFTGVTPGPANESAQLLTPAPTISIVAAPVGFFTVAPFMTGAAPSYDLNFTVAPGMFGTAQLKLTVKDNGGTANGGDDTLERFFSINVAAVNDAPTITLPSTITANEDAAKFISGIVIADADSGPANIQVKLKVQKGKLNLNTGVAGGVTAGQVTGNNSTEVTITAPVAAIQTTLAAVDLSANPIGISYQGDLHYNNLRAVPGDFTPVLPAGFADRLVVNVSDLGNTGPSIQTATLSRDISITPVNDLPTVLGIPDQSVTDTMPTTVDFSNIPFYGSNFFDDEDMNDTPPDYLAYSVTGNSNPGLLSAAFDGFGDLVLTVVGVVTSPTTVTVQVTATDLASASVNDSFVVTINPTDDPPVLNVPASSLLSPIMPIEDTAFNFTDPTPWVSDTDSPNLTVAISAGQGFLTLGSLVGLTINSGSNGSGAVTFTGSVANVNTALNGMTYQGNADYFGLDQISMSVTDGTSSDSDNVFLYVQPKNDAPTAVADNYTGGNALAEDAGPTVLSLLVNDVKGPSNESGQSLSIVGLNAFGNNTLTTPSGGTVVIAPSGLTVTYTPAPGFFGTETFQYLIQDNGQSFVPAVNDFMLSALATVTIQVTATNDAPDISSDATEAINEDAPLPLGATGANIVVRDDHTTGTQVSPLSLSAVTVLLSALNGTFNVATTGGATVSGNGSSSVTITGTVAAINASLALPGSNYIPNANYNGADTITAVVNDGGNIGGGPNLSDTTTTAVTIASINDEPSTVLSAPVVFAPVAAGPQTVNGFIVSTSPGPADESAQTVAVTVASVSDPNFVLSGPVTLSGTGAGANLTYTRSGTGAGQATVTLNVVDSGPNAPAPNDNNATQTFVIQIGNNKEPVFTNGGNLTYPLGTGATQILPSFVSNAAAIAVAGQEFPFSQPVMTYSIQQISTNNPDLFDVAPSLIGVVGSSGPGILDGKADLTFKLDPAEFGTATLRITVMDDGGTSFGGDDTATQDFTITVNPPTGALDFGDAPAPYPTLLADNGARHVLAGPVSVTTNVGPINHGIAAQDGATGTGYVMYSVQSVHTRFAGSPPYIANSDHMIAVRYNGGWQYDNNSSWVNFTPTTSDRLIAAIDFDADTIVGLLGASGQVQGINQGYASSNLVFQANVFEGGPNTGEFTITGTSYTVVADLKLGSTVDAEANGQPNGTATGDGADEDGVTFVSPLVAGGTATIQVQATQTGFLNAWIDFNDDGDWLDAGEKVFNNQVVYAGTNTLSVAVPNSAAIDETFARFRLDSVGGLAATGFAIDGEVEDYAVDILAGSTKFFVGGPLESIVAPDDATGTGYIMYSDTDVHVRFGAGPIANQPYPGAASRLIAVRYNGANWQYANNDIWVTFAPAVNDRLLASVDFTADTVTSLVGMTGNANGIEIGYSSGDLAFIANQFGGSPNVGEFDVTGTCFVVDPNAPTTFSGFGPVEAVAAQDSATGAAYIMYSALNLSTRFAGPNAPYPSTERFVIVRFNGGQWQYDNNSAWINFIPDAGDRLLASVDLGTNVVTSLIGMSGQVNGINQGYVAGDLVFVSESFGGSPNAGEFDVLGTFFTA